MAEALFALIGAMVGTHLISKLKSIDHWIAFTLLAGVALHMAYEDLSDLLSKEIKIEKLDFHSFTKVLIVSFATSLDAFGVGIGWASQRNQLLPTSFQLGFGPSHQRLPAFI